MVGAAGHVDLKTVTPAHHDPDAPVDRALLDLIRRPYVAEVLAALDDKPSTLTELSRAAGTSRRAVAAALRALAAHHAVSRTPVTGTWDRAGRHGRYRLTPAGHALIRRLFDLDVWTTVYRPDDWTDPDGGRTW